MFLKNIKIEKTRRVPQSGLNSCLARACLEIQCTQKPNLRCYFWHGCFGGAPAGRGATDPPFPPSPALAITAFPHGSEHRNGPRGT